jgi:hypothetical protein
MAQGRAIGVSLTQQLAKLEKDLTEVRNQFLVEMANEIVDTSPIWAGQYVTSHSINTMSAAGRFTGNLETGMTEKSSYPEAYKAEGRANLMSDISALPEDTTSVYLNNNSPHAKIVESGGWSSGKPPYKVYARAVARAGIHMAQAIAKVRGSQ